MPPSAVPLTLIVAATPALGIGRAGTLPWPQLRSEMAYFARVTKRASTAGSVNAVIMGRRTWESIPTAFRPLRGRINVVISRSLNIPLEWKPNKKGEDDGTAVLSASSFDEALKVLEGWKEDKPLSKVFVIGGAEIYRTALELENANRVLLTRIKTEFECDVHFPLKLGETSGWKKAEKKALDEFTGEEVPTGVQSENGVEWEFEMWTKAEKPSWQSMPFLFNH